jgi:hypothetical protein
LVFVGKFEFNLKILAEKVGSFCKFMQEILAGFGGKHWINLYILA